MNNEPWRDLRIGDRVRIVRFPAEWNQPGYYLHPATRRLYKQLIERRRAVRVCQIDDWGLPYIRCQFRRRNGKWEYHWLSINDDSWVRVQRRKARPPRPRPPAR